MVQLRQVQVANFFVKQEESHPSQLSQELEFIFSTTSTVVVLDAGKGFDEYPTVNPLPPFWKYLVDAKKGDKDLGKYSLTN